MPLLRSPLLSALAVVPHLAAASSPAARIPAAVGSSPILAEAIRTDVATLSSDAMLGRGPGEDGETRAIAYLAAQMAQAGLEPAGDDGGWTQAVPLVRLDRLPGSALSLTIAGHAVPLTIGGDSTVTLRNPGKTAISSAPLVFVGYGTVDKAHGWDPYSGVDMRGKVAVMPRTIVDSIPALNLQRSVKLDLSVGPPILVLCMGEAGLWSRVLAGYFGAPFTFARGERAAFAAFARSGSRRMAAAAF